MQHLFASGDVYIVKTDASGDQTWAKTVGGVRPDFGASVQLATGGGYIVAGTTASYGAGGEDIWLIRTDADGNTVMSKNPHAGPQLDRQSGRAGNSTRFSGSERFMDTHPYRHGRRTGGK